MAYGLAVILWCLIERPIMTLTTAGGTHLAAANDLPGVGNEPEGDSLRGNHSGWFVGVIPTFPAEN